MKVIQKLFQKTLYSNSESVIVDYIIQHKEDIIDMPIHKLAKATYTSNPTILRVCRKCGTKGYKDFKIKLAKEIEQLTADMSHIDVNIPFYKEESGKVIARHIGELYQESIRRTYALIQESTISEATQIIDNSQMVYLFGYGDCAIQAMNFRNKLIKIKKYSIIAMEHQQQVFHSYNMTKDDCAIFISYRGQKRYLPILKFITQKNVPIICITANSDSVVAKYSNVVLEIAKNEDEKSKIASFSSQIEIEYIFNVLYACLFEKDYDYNYRYKNSDLEPLYEQELFRQID